MTRAPHAARRVDVVVGIDGAEAVVSLAPQAAAALRSQLAPYVAAARPANLSVDGDGSAGAPDSGAAARLAAADLARRLHAARVEQFTAGTGASRTGDPEDMLARTASVYATAVTDSTRPRTRAAGGITSAPGATGTALSHCRRRRSLSWPT